MNTPMLFRQTASMKDGLFPSGRALVVGGSGGIGRSIVAGLVANGSDVVFTYHRNRDAAAEAVEEYRGLGRQADALQLDLTDAEAISATIKQIRQNWGRIHTLIFAAGADISMTYVSATDAEEWHRTIASDLNGFFLTVQPVLHLMRQDGGGSILALSSAGTVRHPPLDILSTAPKAGIEALIRGIAREEGRFNIRANVVAPGMVAGGIADRILKKVTPQFAEAMRRNNALGRFGELEEVSSVCIFLASSVASYITGQCIVVDGGYSV